MPKGLPMADFKTLSRLITRLVGSPPRRGGAILFILAAAWGPAGSVRAEEPIFGIDVMAVLSKAGCNAGTCHGNQKGKGGFKLSLRGDDPTLDYRALVYEHASRRIDRFAPRQSLILLKPTMALGHQGGRRFGADSREYDILRRWIQAGAPNTSPDSPTLERIEATPNQRVLIDPEDRVGLRVTATFSDGSRRDVTRLAVYEPSTVLARVDPDGMIHREAMGETTILVRYLSRQVPVRLAFVPTRPNFVWNGTLPYNYVDRHVLAKLRTLRMNSSELVGDGRFVRRAYLDAVGILPTAEAARAFVADPRVDKRRRLIDRLLERPEFADFWALKWSDILRNEEKVLDPKGVANFYHWIRQSLVEGKPIDEFVRELVAARGSTYLNPPASYYRALRDPLSRGESTAQLFLGVRLKCARCHNHPFERWTQDDYYSWAAVFGRIDYKILSNVRLDRLDKNEFQGEQVVLVKDNGEVTNPRTGREAAPRFLGSGMLELNPTDDRLAPLADWLTSGRNRMFARAQVNRIWYHLMGRGLVEPIDDFRATNPASHEELLDELADDLVVHRFDLRHMVRVIMNSRSYQLAAEPNDTNGEDQTNYSRAIIRRLSAEQLLDAQCQVLDVSADFNGYPVGIRAGQIPGVKKVRLRDKRPAGGDRFLKTFGKPQRLLTCECERAVQTTLAQAFVLIGGEDLNERLTEPGNRLDRLARSDTSNNRLVDELYWTALGRPPSGQELAASVALLSASGDDRLAACQDIAWALLNAKEFVFRW